MKLAHFDFDNTFEISSDRVNVLVVEPEDIFFNYCRELLGQISGETGNFCLSEGDESLRLDKAGSFVWDYFSLQSNDKKLTAKLYSSLQQIAETHFLSEYQQILSLFADLFSKLNAESDCPISYDEEAGLPALFKSFDVKIEQENGLLEKLLLFVRLQTTFFKTKCFFFANLKTVLTEHSLMTFYHEMQLNDVCIFLLENSQKPKLPSEIVTIIDRDLCEIIA